MSENLNDLATQYSFLSTRIEECKETEKTLQEERRSIEQKIQAYMEASELSKFSMDGLGTFYNVEKMSIRVPKGEDKMVFFEHLKKEGSFNDLATINSMTLQGYYKSKAEEAAAKNEPLPDIPGLKEISFYKQLHLRKN